MTLILHSLGYERQFIPLFENINAQLDCGMLLQIQGPNGSGKTTLLKILAGFFDPTHGQVLWQKKSISTIRETYQEKIAYLGHLNGLKSHLTLSENIKIMCALEEIDIRDISVDSILHQLSLSDMDRPVKQLSMGQLRRLSFARLLLASKTLWLLDEPTTGVDREGQIIFNELLTTHLQKGGIAIVSTHHPLADSFSPLILHLGGNHA